jgi:uncharacterized protein YuzE
MKIRYSPDVDAIYITLKEADVSESDEISNDVIADYDENGNIVGIEILWVSEKADLDQLIIQAFDKDKVKIETEVAETIVR